MINLDELYEICDECSIYGDDYYFDKETGEYEPACEDCWVTKARGKKNDSSRNRQRL